MTEKDTIIDEDDKKIINENDNIDPKKKIGKWGDGDKKLKEASGGILEWV